MIHTDLKTIEFINNNINSDTTKLLLKARKFEDLDIPFIVDQIICRKSLKNKLPDWSKNDRIILPSKISTEQCSSQQTALYKSALIKGGILCDLTGGMGVDSYYFSLNADKVIYIERYPDYCQAAQHNFKELGANNIIIINQDSTSLSSITDSIDYFYIDPARRSDSNKRLFAIDQCEPDVLQLKEPLLNKASTLIIKISPMADITFTLSLLPETEEIHCVSVKNECKELIFVLKNNKDHNKGVNVRCINFENNDEFKKFDFIYSDESIANVSYAKEISEYIYEPNASIMKTGAFKSISQEFKIEKLGVNTHLYSSDRYIEDFPGRVFKVNTVHEFSSSTYKKIGKTYPKANITTRNFPITVDEFRKKTSIKDGGDIYLFATTLGNDRKIIIESYKP